MLKIYKAVASLVETSGFNADDGAEEDCFWNQPHL